MPERIVTQISDTTHVPYRYLRWLVPVLRWSKSVAYVCLFVAGILNLFPHFQPTVLRDTAESRVQLYAWAAVLIVSGGLCAYGSIAGVWWGEYVGLLPLFMLSVIYGVSALFIGDGGITRGLFLLALALLVLARWEDQAIVRAVVAREARERSREDRHHNDLAA